MPLSLEQLRARRLASRASAPGGPLPLPPQAFERFRRCCGRPTDVGRERWQSSFRREHEVARPLGLALAPLRGRLASFPRSRSAPTQRRLRLSRSWPFPWRWWCPPPPSMSGTRHPVRRDHQAVPVDAAYCARVDRTATQRARPPCADTRGMPLVAVSDENLRIRPGRKRPCRHQPPSGHRVAVGGFGQRCCTARIPLEPSTAPLVPILVNCIAVCITPVGTSIGSRRAPSIWTGAFQSERSKYDRNSTNPGALRGHTRQHAHVSAVQRPTLGRCTDNGHS